MDQNNNLLPPPIRSEESVNNDPATKGLKEPASKSLEKPLKRTKSDTNKSVHLANKMSLLCSIVFGILTITLISGIAEGVMDNNGKGLNKDGNLQSLVLPRRRQGRVLTGTENGTTTSTSTSTTTTLPLSPSSKSSSSEEAGSSRKASPDVQDIIDGIVKLLGGKVHNGTPVPGPGGQGQLQGQLQGHPQQAPRPLTSPNPYNLFHPTKPFSKPSRINNRGPVLPGQQQQQQDSFEAIPLEALSTDFNLNKGNFGPPFPIQGGNGGIIQSNLNHGGNLVEPPFKQGVPLPEMVIPQGQNHGHQQGVHYNPYFQNQLKQQQQQLQQQQLQQQQYHQQQQQHSQRPAAPQLSSPQPQPQPSPGLYNPFGFQHPTHLPTPPVQQQQGTKTPSPTTTNKRPIIKFPTKEEEENQQQHFQQQSFDDEDDEEDEMRFTTPKGQQQPHVSISPTPSKEKDTVYPTLLLHTNAENGLVELTEVHEDKKISSSSSGVIAPASTTTISPVTISDVSKISPIFYPNGNFNGGSGSGSTTEMPKVSSTASSNSLPTPPLRPGFVLNETPPPSSAGSAPTPRPAAGGVGSVEVVTADEGAALLASHGGHAHGDIFDVTVTAKQSYGKGGMSQTQSFDVLTSPQGTEQFVSIDGRRTYFNLHPNTATGSVQPTKVTLPKLSSTILPPTLSPPAPSKNIGVGSVGDPVPLLPQPPGKTLFNSNSPPLRTQTSLSISKSPPLNIIRRPLTRRPTSPPVRIDTCIVGDDATCNTEQGEVCKTENGVSSCICRSGYARRRHREPCKAIIALQLSLKLDKLGEKKLTYNPDYFNPNSEIYQTLEWETIHAMDASMSETTLSGGYVGAKLDAIGFDGKHAVVNTTLLIQENPKLLPPQLKKEIQKQMIQVLTKHRNNFGKSQLWVEGPISSVSAITDINECEDDELNDCNSKASCTNTFGSFECHCEPGYGDPFEKDKRRSGRRCDSCSGKYHCNGRGECLIENGEKICKCNGNYYGSHCDFDGEVLAVAIGASISAVVIIALTLACLCMWSRKWKKEEQKAALMSRTLFGGFGGKGGNPYQQHVTLDDRLRWAQVAESNMTGNIYVQNDPMSIITPHPQLMDQHTPPMMARRQGGLGHGQGDDSCGEGDIFEERAATNKRPRSRASQGSIYYDLDPEQNEIYASRSLMHFPPVVPPPAQFCVPMSHYGQTGRGYYS